MCPVPGIEVQMMPAATLAPNQLPMVPRQRRTSTAAGTGEVNRYAIAA
jgi:hypothetical protein